MKPPSALGLPRPSTEWLLILPPDLSSNASDALRAARADDRLYDPLCLNRLERVINSNAAPRVAARVQRGYLAPSGAGIARSPL